MERPLITFLLVGYNQEAFIQEAIQAAFSQDYSPLEIILSDDASTDGTFQIMNNMAAEYTGPHTLMVKRSPSNEGIVGHVNRLMEIAHGELVVIAAGDDISFPDRVTQTYDLWQEDDRRADMLYFNYEPFGSFPSTYVVDAKTHALDFQIEKGGSRVFGSTSAWTKRLFDFFGPLHRSYAWEDKGISFRAVLLGGLACKDIPVIRYRQDRPPVSWGSLPMSERMLQSRLGFYVSFAEDIQILLARSPHRQLECERLLVRIKRHISAIKKEQMLFIPQRVEKLIGLFYLWTGQTWTKRALKTRASLSMSVLRDL
jgi:glycosyltransferase involved in cell wall biosynthesis